MVVIQFKKKKHSDGEGIIVIPKYILHLSCFGFKIQKPGSDKRESEFQNLRRRKTSLIITVGTAKTEASDVAKYPRADLTIALILSHTMTLTRNHHTSKEQKAESYQHLRLIDTWRS